MRSTRQFVQIILLALVTLAGAARANEPVTLMHVHGLSYTAEGKQLMIPSHHGLAIYANGRWSKAPGPAHDYMGFAATRDALYSSGHPAPGSGFVNPFGLIRSRDGGKTWQKLGLEGESDFHLLATSHGTNGIFVFNTAPNSRMRNPGIHYTLDDGMKWQAAAGKGLRGELATLAVHPSDARIVAVGTSEGLFLSRDSAQSFMWVASGRRVLGTRFDLDGRHLWFSTYAAKAGLSRVALEPGAKPEDIAIPELPGDAIAYIAQNPVRRDEIAVATFKRSVFVSPDRARSWKQIATEGTGKDH
jgi:photosystem II stability/assembly factor-like uncharacterized protein